MEAAVTFFLIFPLLVLEIRATMSRQWFTVAILAIADCRIRVGPTVCARARRHQSPIVTGAERAPLSAFSLSYRPRECSSDGSGSAPPRCSSCETRLAAVLRLLRSKKGVFLCSEYGAESRVRHGC